MSIDLPSFYSQKSIQKSFRFSLSIMDTKPNRYLPNNQQMPDIKSYHCLSVTFPTFGEIKREIQYCGVFPASFPVYNSDGNEFSIVLEEDQFGTIGQLVRYLQARMFSDDGKGLFTNPARNLISEIKINILDDNDKTVAIYSFPDAYFIKCDNLNYSYQSAESIKYSLTFVSDLVYFNEEVDVEDDGQMLPASILPDFRLA